MLVSWLQSFEHKKRNKQTEGYRKVSASGNQTWLHPSLWKLPKTVERLLVDRKNTAAEATEWVDGLNQPTIRQVSEFGEFRNNNDDIRNDYMQSSYYMYQQGTQA